MNSIYSENTEKIKAKQRRQTQKWKEQHQKEKLKKKLQANSKSKLAHQTQTIIKEASHLSIKLLNDEDYTSETEFSEEESTDNEWSNEEYDETDEISEDSTDDDPDDFLTRCKSLMEKDKYIHLTQCGEFIKYSKSITCGINQIDRNCYINAPIQLFARINPALMSYEISKPDIFNSLKTSMHSIRIPDDLYSEILQSIPDDEDAITVVDFLIHKFELNSKYDNGYFIHYIDSIDDELKSIKYSIKTAINPNSINENPISSFALFQASLRSQIDHYDNEFDIIACHPPPILFIELWQFEEIPMKRLKFDNFIIQIEETKYEYHCIGSLIHIHDHFKTIAFDHGQIVLLDDDLVVNLASEENDTFNIYREIEFQNLHERSRLLAFQIVENQIEEYYNS